MKNKFRKIGFILMLSATGFFFIVNLVYWSVLIIESRESPIMSAVLMSLFFGSIPFAITFLTYYIPPVGSIVTIVISILVICYWFFALFSDSIRTNPILVYGGILSALVFLVGGMFIIKDIRPTKN